MDFAEVKTQIMRNPLISFKVSDINSLVVALDLVDILR
jgi:hypothetical protein